MAGNQRALPDLVARARIDPAQLVGGAAIGSEATKGLEASVLRLAVALEGFDVVTKKSTVSQVEHAGALELVKTQLTGVEAGALKAGAALDLVNTTSGKLGGGLGVGGGILGALGLAGAALAAPLGLLGVLDALTQKQATYAASVLRTSEVTGLDTTMTQVLGKAMDAVGLSSDNLQNSIETFNKSLATGAPTLSKLGLSLADIGVTSKNTGEAFLQAAEFVHTHTDAMQNAAIASALFGRNGQQMLPVLQLGRQFFQDYTAELEHFGVILNGDQLATAAFTNAANAQFKLALQGIETQFVAPLQTGFALLEITLTKSLAGAAGAAEGFGAAVGHVVTVIASFIGGLLGIKIKLADFTDLATSASSKLAGINQAATDATGGIGGTTAAIKDNTAALKDQVTAIDDQVREQDQAFTAELKIYNLEDARLNQLKAQISLQRTAEADALKLTKDNQAIVLAAWQGNTAELTNLGEQLTTDKQKQADDQQTAGIDAAINENRAKIRAVQDEKTAYDQYQQDRKQKLQQAIADEQQAAAAQKSAAIVGNTGALDSSNAFVKGLFGNFAQIDKGAQDTGKAVTAWLKDPWSPKHQQEVTDLVTGLILDIAGLFDPSKEPGQTVVAMGVKLGLAVGYGILGGIAGVPGNLVSKIFNVGVSDAETRAHEIGFLANDLQYNHADKTQAIKDFQDQFGKAPTADELGAAGYGPGPGPGIPPQPFASGGLADAGQLGIFGHGPELWVPPIGGRVLNREDSMAVASAVASGAAGSGRPGGGDIHYHITVNAPNYYGPENQLAGMVRDEIAQLHY